MKISHIKAFWIGFIATTVLTAWIYWILSQKREVAPEPLVVSQSRPPAAVRVKRPAETTNVVQISDPLEEIKGIGPVFANRLNDAGITTFAELANSSPAELQEITGVARWDPAEWIVEAKALANA
jgi:predicted flap endonuclease-1-like 5' DNA nuclease